MSQSQLRFIPNPATNGADRVAAGIIDDDPDELLAALGDRVRGPLGRALSFQLSAIMSAIDDAGLDVSGVDTERMGIFDGTSRDGFGYWYERIHRAADASAYTRRDLVPGMSGIGVGLAASVLGVNGPTYTFSGSCCSGAIAVGHAFREVRDGEIDVAIAGGHDAALTLPLFRMYKDAGLLSTEQTDADRALLPYGGDTGNAFGEGAVMLVLESMEHARRRGARILATIDGYRYGNGGEHPTHVDRSGKRPARLIRSLLESNELSPHEVDFVVGHGNGVAQSDRSETSYMRDVFGDAPHEVPLLSTKPIYGHTLGASSAVNVAAAVMMVHHAHHAREGAPGVGLSVSYGIGGNNSAILVRRVASQDARWKHRRERAA
jgi:3-oxoacyl-(acyl-carrier-protein) synthase